MKRIAGYFLQGLIIVVPVALTFWLLGGVFLTIDEGVRQLTGRWLPGAALPGVGMLAMLTLITLVGFLGSHFFTRRLVQAFGALLERVPVVKMLYGALKDLLSAFVGPERRFDRPVARSEDGSHSTIFAPAVVVDATRVRRDTHGCGIVRKV